MNRLINKVLCCLVLSVPGICVALDGISGNEQSSTKKEGFIGVEKAEVNSFWMPAKVDTVPIVKGLKQSKLYRVGASSAHLLRDGAAIGISGVALVISGTALVEGKNISIKRNQLYRGVDIGNYTQFNEDEVEIKGPILFTGKNGISLIADMEKERNLRLCINSIEVINGGEVQDRDWVFNIYLDGTKIESSIHNESCIDVGGKQVALELSSWPARVEFKITGSYKLKQ